METSHAEPSVPETTDLIQFDWTSSMLLHGLDLQFHLIVEFHFVHCIHWGTDVYRYKLHCTQESSMGVFVFAFGFVVVRVRVRVRIWLRVRVRASTNCIVRVRVRQTYVLFGKVFST